MRRFRMVAVSVTALVVTLAACGGSSGSSGSGDGGGGGVAASQCPVGALDKASASAPVEITFWHAMTRANEEALQRLITEYEAQQPKVKVKLVNQTAYRDTFEKYKAGLRTGDLPDVVQIEDTATQQMIDTQSIVPMGAVSRPTSTTRRTSSSGPSPTTRSRARCGRCRSTCRTPSCTTTRTRSPQPASTRTSHPRRSTTYGVQQEDQGGRSVRVRLRPQARPVVHPADVGQGRRALREQRQRP